MFVKYIQVLKMNIFLHIMQAGNKNFKKNEKVCKPVKFLKNHPNCDGFITQ